MSNINYTTKPNGSTNWADGDTAHGADISADFNIVATVVNGNLETSNLKAAAGIVNGQLAANTLTDSRVSTTADIDPGKINDYSATNAEQNTMSSPGNSAANTLAVTLEKELEQLRFVSRRLSVGTSAKITNGTSSGLKADGSAAWFEVPVNGLGLLRNPAFLDATANGTANPPFGWTAVQTPSTLARVALDVSEGAGEAIHIVDDGGADCGISQTLTNLRANSLYLVICRMKPITTTFRLATTGATGTYGNLAVVSVSGGSVWQNLAGIISTDATPTAIVVSLAATAANAACHVDYFDVLPMGGDKTERPRGFRRTKTSTSNVAATIATNTTTSFVVPAPGMTVLVRGVLLTDATNNTSGTVVINEDVNGGGFAAVRAVTIGNAATGGTISLPASVQWESDVLTPGSVYSYQLTFTGTIGGGGVAGREHTLTVELSKSA